MNILKLNSLCGVKNQMYCPEQYVDANKKAEINNGFFDINSLFWSQILSPNKVRDILNLAKIRLKNDNSVKIKAVLQNPEVFFETFTEALKVFNQTTTQQELFQSLETLEIVCLLYTKLYSSPFALTISNGYIHNCFSALDLNNICLQPYYNPYLNFIESEIIPRVLLYNPQMLILTGKPNIASFAIAKIIREKLPQVLIIASEHESEYYSLRKIEDLLISNNAFFSVYHCVVLNDSANAIEKIKQTFSKENIPDLSLVPGIIYSIDGGKTILKTTDIVCDQPSKFDITNIVNTKVVNIKGFPKNHCHWNRCSFCGINSKYINNNNKNWDIIGLIEKIRFLNLYGIRKFWFLDEAIPIRVLCEFAELLIENKIHIIWHVRTRIEPEYIEDSTVELLHQAGLRHILFGFESASPRILSLMQKTEGNFNYLEIAEKIVRVFTNMKINVHFSAIIGFPTETKEECLETSNFLKYIIKNYNNFSYNINSYYLDIGSPIYKRWEKFGICSLAYPCTPKYFLENHLDWNGAVLYDKSIDVQKEKEQLMVLQYPWYPKGSLVTPSAFFAFWEFSRNSLQQENLDPQKQYEKHFSYDDKVKLSLYVNLSIMDDDSWVLYNLKNHHFVIGGNVLYDIFKASNNNEKFFEVIKKYENYKNEVIDLITELTRLDFFEN